MNMRKKLDLDQRKAAEISSVVAAMRSLATRTAKPSRRLDRMATKRNRNIQLAHAVLDWNRKNLRHDTRLTQDVIKECFGDRFVIEPNGRHYQANPGVYLEFLNGMKQSMLGIEYQVTHTVADDESVMFDMSVQMDHVDGRRERFVAMLLMKFDGQEKVSLWKEIYLNATA